MMKISTTSILLAALLPAADSSLHAETGAKGGFVPGGAKDVAVPRVARNGRWEVHAGFGIRQAFDLDLRSTDRTLTGGYYSITEADLDLAGFLGPLGGQANRLYDDGFVNIGSQYNLTSFWGYDDASQVRPSSRPWDPSQPWDAPGVQSLYLSRVGETGVSGYRREADTGAELFPYIEARRLWQSAESGFWDEKGVAFGWSWIPARAGMAESLSVLRTVVVDEYYLYGVLPPSAPYTGPALPPGALLDNVPHDRVENTAAAGLSGRVATDIDFDLHTLSLGGIWRYSPEIGPQDALLRVYGFDLQAGVSLNFGKLSMNTTTTVTDGGVVIGSFRDYASKSKVLPGLYASLGATLDVGERGDWMIYTAGRYDQAGHLEVRTQNSSAKVSLDGFSWTIGLGREW